MSADSGKAPNRIGVDGGHVGGRAYRRRWRCAWLRSIGRFTAGSAGDANLGSFGPGDGTQRKGEDARSPSWPGRHRRRRVQTRCSLQLEIDPDQIKHIPANVEARIDVHVAVRRKVRGPGLSQSTRARNGWPPGAVLRSQNVTVEVNTVFQNLVELIKQIDPAKLNAVLSALAEGVRGQGERIGEAITDANEVLLALNPRTETMREDWRASRTSATPTALPRNDIIDTLSAASTTSET